MSFGLFQNLKIPTYLFFTFDKNLFYALFRVMTPHPTVFQERGAVAAETEPKDKMQDMREQVDGVKNIMTQNVDRIIARGERLDDLMGRSEDLQAGVSAPHVCLSRAVG